MNTHLTDDEFQSYLDGTPDTDIRDIERHLRECPACRNGIARYRELYRALSIDPVPHEQEMLAPQVLRRIESMRERKVRHRENFAVTLISAVGLGICIYLSHFFAFFLPLLEEVRTYLEIMSSGYGNVFVLAVMVVMVLLLYDRVSRRLLRNNY